MEHHSTCRSCGSQITDQMRFCSMCGRRLIGRKRGLLLSGIIGALTISGLALGLQIFARDGRVKPSPHPVASNSSLPSTGQNRSQSTQVAQSNSEAPPQLATMRKELERSPEDLTKLKLFAGMLGDHLRNNPNAAPELIYEAIDIFGRILQREPNDPGALILMADVSFDQRAFTKALDFYERYLTLESEDLGARARYASTLTFLGRFDDSVNELGKVIKSDPNNFPAMAYLAITYAQKGEIDRAKSVGADALKLAPSDEARARFSSFVASLDEAAVGARGGAGVAATPSAPSAASPVAGGGLASFIQTVKSNPVAGPKFAGYKQESAETLKLLFTNFPMAQMPPFAKQKFFTGLKESLAKNKLDQITKIEFIDANSLEVIERLGVK